MPTDVEALAAELEKLSPPDKLRLAAELLETGRMELAYAIAYKVAMEMGAYLALLKKGPK